MRPECKSLLEELSSGYFTANKKQILINSAESKMLGIVNFLDSLKEELGEDRFAYFEKLLFVSCKNRTPERFLKKLKNELN